MKQAEPFHQDIRIGDLIGVMIFANYLKKIELYERLVYNLQSTMKHIDQSLNIEVLFSNVIDEFVVQSNQNHQINNIEKRGVGCIWTTVPALVAKYGQQIIPNLHLDLSLYTGPNDLDWNNYICFSPLFNVTYNGQRQMDTIFCNDLIDRLYDKYGNKLLIITDQPNKVRNKNVNIYVDVNLYNLAYIISNSMMFIGGDTGFTHLSGMGKSRAIVSIYEPNQLRHYNICRDHRYPKSYWDSTPMIDRSKSIHLHMNMDKDFIKMFNSIDSVIDIIYRERYYEHTGEWK